MAAVLVACADEDLVLSYEGSEANFAEALDAAAEWRACGASIRVARESGHVPLRGVDVVRDLEGRPVPGKAGATVHVAGRPLDLQFRDDRTRAPFVLRHEMGHALGIVRHGSDGVMVAEMNDATSVTPADCALLPAR